MRYYVHLGHGCFKFGNVIGQNEGDYLQWSPSFFNSETTRFFTAERVASVYICTRKHSIIRFLYKIYVHTDTGPYTGHTLNKLVTVSNGIYGI